jgi:hypothetical protein
VRAALLLFLFACAPTWTRGDHYQVQLRGSPPPPTSLAQWQAYVTAGVALWAPAFDATCPFPFVLDTAGPKFVALVTASAWTEPSQDEGYATKPGLYVKVSPDADHRAILAHEFGHAMGLSHVTRLTSIMYPTMDDIKVPDAQDFKDARAAMGCP